MRIFNVWLFRSVKSISIKTFIKPTNFLQERLSSLYLLPFDSPLLSYPTACAHLLREANSQAPWPPKCRRL